MTVARLRAEMPNNEFHQWRAFVMYRAQMQEQANREARRRRGR